MFRSTIFSTVLMTTAMATPEPVSAQDPAARCRNIDGTFVVHTFTENCDSPVGLCGKVDWRGDLNATSQFVATSFIQTGDSGVTGVVVSTGDAVIALRDGTLSTKDAIVLRTVGNGDFAEVDAVVDGTGAWAGATGAWRASGTFNGNLGSGVYRGQICR